MKIILMRHSEPDYSDAFERNYVGQGIDLGQLTENGIQIAEKASLDSRLDNAELIVSSPYTRALQTAAIVSKNRKLDIKVEIDLHEWIPDYSFKYTSFDECQKAIDLLKENNGLRPDNSPINYETIDELFTRAKNALLKYTDYNKIIVVAHGMVISRFIPPEEIPYCGMYEIDFDKSFKCRPLIVW